jgi:hypothetical protein
MRIIGCQVAKRNQEETKAVKLIEERKQVVQKETTR